jgi:hypothetical protein
MHPVTPSSGRISSFFLVMWPDLANMDHDPWSTQKAA